MAKWVTWNHTWAEKNKNGFHDKLVAEGKITEDIQPNIEPYAFYRDAYLELSSCKSAYESPIPFTSIVEYFKIYGEGEDFEDFIFVIRKMDEAHSDSIKKKEKSNGPTNASQKNNSKVRHPR